MRFFLANVDELNCTCSDDLPREEDEATGEAAPFVNVNTLPGTKFNSIFLSQPSILIMFAILMDVLQCLIL